MHEGETDRYLIRESYKTMKLVFFGTPTFAVPTLEAIIADGHQVVAVVTAPDKPAGRGLQLRPSPVKECAIRHELTVLQPTKLSELGFIEQLQSLEADLFVVVAFRMLPEAVWNMPPRGSYNLHSSLLPDYRGAAPINRAIMNGETVSGVTTFKLKHEIDTGDILFQKQLDIGPDETAGELHDRMMMAGAELVVQTLQQIQSGNATTIEQASLIQNRPVLHHAPKIFSADCRIDWNRTCLEIHNQIRGLSPFPGAFTYLKKNDGSTATMKIFKSKPFAGQPLMNCGNIQFEENRLMVACADGYVEVLELQLEGKKRMPTADFLRGTKLIDSRFE